jgi:hypothetical protein
MPPKTVLGYHLFLFVIQFMFFLHRNPFAKVNYLWLFQDINFR